MLVNGIINNLEPAFEAFTERLDGAADLLALTPYEYNPAAFNTITNLGIILFPDEKVSLFRRAATVACATAAFK